MTIVANQTTLTRKDYPEFDQTVGNSFASSYPDTVQKADSDLNRLANVSQGLFKIYENVVDDAAKGAPMTPFDSAVISTTVANMTSSIGVESEVCKVASLESRYDQHMGYIVTQESLSATIRKTIGAFIDAFVRLLQRVGVWIKSWIDAAADNGRPVIRALNTVQRLANAAVASVKYTPSMSGILVDGQIPADWFARASDTLSIIKDLSGEQDKMIAYGQGIMDHVAKISTGTIDAEAIQKALEKDIDTSARVTLGRRRDRSESYPDKEIEWSVPLCGNTIAIAMNPKGIEAIDSVNYGASLISTAVASEFGVKTKYASLEGTMSDSLVTIDIGDYSRNGKRLEVLLAQHGTTMQRLNNQVDKIQDALRKVTDRFRSNKLDEETDNESMQALLTYAGVARSVVSAAVASARMNHECFSNTASSVGAIFSAVNKKAGFN